MCSACHLGVLGVDQHRNTSFAGVTRALCVCKPVFLEHWSKWWIMHEAPCSKAVRQGDPREQGCVWKIWRSVWSSMTTSLLLYTPPFSNSNQTVQFKIGCTGSPQSSRTFTVLSPALLSGILFIHR